MGGHLTASSAASLDEENFQVDDEYKYKLKMG